MSALVPMSVSGFSKAFRRVNHLRGLRLTRHDLARVAAVLGHDSFFATGQADRRRRVSIALNTTQAVRIQQDRFYLIDGFAELDPQEKAQISFLLAGSLTTWFAQRALRAPWVMPMKHLVRQARVSFQPGSGRRRPDFVAYTRHWKWHVLESKGRTWSAGRTGTYAKGQAQVIRRINGRAPSTRVASIAHLGSAICMTVVDPDADSDRSVVEVPDDVFWKQYYGWFVDDLSEPGLRAEHRTGDNGFEMFHDDDAGVAIGLWLPTLRWAQGGYKGPPPICKTRTTEDRSVGADGFSLSIDASRRYELSELRKRLPHSVKPRR